MARDWDILDAIRGLLVASGEFDGVYRSATPEQKGQAAGDRIAAVVAPLSWEEICESDDPDVIQSLRKVVWQLTLIVREEDPETRERTLDRLLAVCQDTLDGQCLAGVTIVPWTWLNSGRYEPPNPPAQAMIVTGRFSYYIEGFTGHDTSAFPGQP